MHQQRWRRRRRCLATTHQRLFICAQHTQRVKMVKTIISHQKTMSYHVVSEQHEQKRFVVYTVFVFGCFHFIILVRLIGWCDVRLSRSDLFSVFFSLSGLAPKGRTLCVVFGCWALLPKVSFEADNTHCKSKKSNIKKSKISLSVCRQCCGH